MKEKIYFVPGGLINWPDATPEELFTEAIAMEQAINEGLYENEEAAIEYYLALHARLNF